MSLALLANPRKDPPPEKRLGKSFRRLMIRVAPMRFLLSIVSPLHLSVLLAVAAGSGNSGAATLCGSSGTESTFGLLPYVAGDGALGRESLVVFQNATREISETISVSDPDSAAMWITTMCCGPI
jgi:hypothetical protein